MAPKRLTVSAIAHAVAAHYGVRVADLLSPLRSFRETRARQVAMWLSRAHTDQSTTQIARALRRDHSSVVHGCQRVEQRLLSEPELVADIAALEKALGAGDSVTLLAEPSTDQLFALAFALLAATRLAQAPRAEPAGRVEASPRVAAARRRDGRTDDNAPPVPRVDPESGEVVRPWKPRKWRVVPYPELVGGGV